jgi:hypothetical protein
MARLSGWKRIGIVVSVAWILGTGIYTFITVDDDELHLCYKQAQDMKGSPEWLLLRLHRALQSTDYLAEAYPPDVSPWPETAIVAFGTVPLGWGFAYFVLFLVHWVKRGFISPGNSN